MKRVIKIREKNIKKDNKNFAITGVCRADMQSIGFDTSTLTDSDMKRIASKMADQFCDCCYWNSLEGILIDIYELEQHEM